MQSQAEDGLAFGNAFIRRTNQEKAEAFLSFNFNRNKRLAGQAAQDNVFHGAAQQICVFGFNGFEGNAVFRRIGKRWKGDERRSGVGRFFHQSGQQIFIARREDDFLSQSVRKNNSGQAGIRCADVVENDAQGPDILADAAAFFGQRRTEQSDVMRFVDHGIKEGTERITVVCFPVGGKFLRRKIVCQIFKRLEFAFYGCQHSHPSYSSNTRACGTQRAIRQLKRLRRFN